MQSLTLRGALPGVPVDGVGALGSVRVVLLASPGESEPHTAGEMLPAQPAQPAVARPGVAGAGRAVGSLVAQVQGQGSREGVKVTRVQGLKVVAF